MLVGCEQLTNRIQGSLPPVGGDFNQLQQCVINLLFNAVDALPLGGEIHISVYVEPKKNHLVISVEDTGTGIVPENLPHIFEPFYTTKKEGYGVGLGLSTVYGIMEQHNGSVDVQSRPDSGTVFLLKLPLV